jgi:hypothetical protein
MATPVARYIVYVDRYLTEDCDGTGLLHDGSGAGAADQLSGELQNAWDTGGVAGHFRVMHREVYMSDNFLPWGYGASRASDCDRLYANDPEEFRPKRRFQVEEATLAIGGGGNLPAWTVVDTKLKLVVSVKLDEATAQGEADAREAGLPL